MTETPFFFSAGATPLFAIYHEATASPHRLPFAFCHPFGEEKLWAHRVYVNFARELAERGHPVLRFDYAGNGDSSGDFRDSTIESASADIDAAVDWLKLRTGSASVGLLGLRLGGTLAALVAARRHDVDRLVLWAPVVRGTKYLQELLRINVTTQLAVYREVREDREALARTLSAGGVVNVDGYEINSLMASQLDALTLLDGPAGFAGPTLIAQLDRQPNARPDAELEQLKGRLTGATLSFVQEEPFWKEIARFYDSAPNLFAATLGWLDTAA